MAACYRPVRGKFTFEGTGGKGISRPGKARQARAGQARPGKPGPGKAMPKQTKLAPSKSSLAPQFNLDDFLKKTNKKHENQVNP